MIEKDLKAPIFKLKDIYDRIIDLEDYKDKKVFIGFFRHAGCPFCNLRVHALTKIHQEMKDNGLEMIFFFESEERVLLRSTFHKEVSPIPLIANPNKEWYATYGLEESSYKSAVSHVKSIVQTTLKAKMAGVPVHMPKGEESINTMPAEFLIDKGLIINRVHYSTSLTNRMEIQDVVDFCYEKDSEPEITAS